MIKLIDLFILTVMLIIGYIIGLARGRVLERRERRVKEVQYE